MVPKEIRLDGVLLENPVPGGYSKHSSVAGLMTAKP